LDVNECRLWLFGLPPNRTAGNEAGPAVVLPL
jgi:hypothetical protein